MSLHNLGSSRPRIFDEFDDDPDGTYFETEWQDMLRQGGSDIMLNDGREDFFGRLEVKGDFIKITQPIMDKVEPQATIRADYRQAQIMLKYMEDHVKDPNTPFPVDLPPYEPVYSASKFENRHIRHTLEKVCKTMNYQIIYENDPYTKDMHTSPSEHKFTGFVDEQTYDGDAVHWRFNPYSIKGSRMVTKMETKEDYVEGMYVLKEQSYYFRMYLKNNPYYEISPEEWYPHMHLPSSVMEAFSLACSKPFWPYKARRRKQQLIPTQYCKVDVTKCETMPPYAISNPLGRLATPYTKLEHVGYMAIGSAHVYHPKWVSVEYLDETQQVWCVPVPNPKAINHNTTELYEHVGEGILVLVQRGFQVGREYYMKSEPTVPNARLAIYTQQKELRLYELPRVFRKGNQSIYVYDKYRSQHTQLALKLFVPIPNAFVNRYGEVLVFDGLPLTEWVFVKQTISKYDAYRCYVANYGGPKGVPIEDILATMSYSEVNEECDSLLWDG
jgi:hypothetical protein